MAVNETKCTLFVLVHKFCNKTSDKCLKFASLNLFKGVLSLERHGDFRNRVIHDTLSNYEMGKAVILTDNFKYLFQTL